MGQFQKGQSGNPGGRPKAVLPDGRTLSVAAREHGLDALRVLVDALSEPTTSFAAAKELLDRGFGKPTQAVELTGEDGGAIQIEQRMQEDADAVTGQLSRLIERARAASVAVGTQH